MPSQDIPWLLRTAAALRSGGSPMCSPLVPEDATSNLSDRPSSSRIFLNANSAVGLRQMLP